MLGLLRITALFACPFIVSLIAIAVGIHEHVRALTIVGAILTVFTIASAVSLVLSLLQILEIAASIYRTRVSKLLPGWSNRG
jgi:hypothetical protein